jgi:hypothetical protein
MRRLLLFIVIVSAAVGAGVALLSTQRQRLAPMAPDDRRRYLDDKLGNRLSDEQLDKLVEAISAKLDGAATTVSEVTDSMVEDATSTASEEVPSGAGAER